MNEIFNENNIVLNVSLRDKPDAIEKAGRILYEQGYVDEQYISCMHQREEVISTYIGNNVAIPHGIDGSEKYIKNQEFLSFSARTALCMAMNLLILLWELPERWNTS